MAAAASKQARMSKQTEADLNAQLSAISRVMAVISFDLQGNILDCNDNFLATMGYTRSEVIGRHHREFVDPAYAESADYKNFWASLRAGQPSVATFNRVGKGGKAVLLQASYNPIFDAAGRPVKVVKYATDLTEQTRAAAEAERAKQLVVQKELERVISAATAGDLTVRLEVSEQDGFMRTVGGSMNKLLDTVSESFSQVKTVVEQISEAAQQLRETSQMMSSSSVELNRAAEESATSLRRATEMVRANSESAGMANQLVTQTATAARGGQARMKDMNIAMTEINASAQQIAKIIKVIDEIAFQTNLLALNAAVEAARAGRHGKGFAVVAAEVRNLAERSAKAAKETAQLIEDSVAKVGLGVKIADDTKLSLDEIIGNVAKVVDLAGEIASASTEQARTLESVSESVVQVNESSQAGSQQSNEVAAAAEELGRQTAALHERMAVYKLLARPEPGWQQALTPALVEQLMGLLAAKGIALPERGRVGATHNDNGAALAPAKPAQDPRAVLPLDRDERGFGGF